MVLRYWKILVGMQGELLTGKGVSNFAGVVAVGFAAVLRSGPPSAYAVGFLSFV